MSGDPMAEGANVHPYRELFRDGHADADAMPIAYPEYATHISRYIRHMSDIRIDAHRQIYPHGQP